MGLKCLFGHKWKENPRFCFEECTKCGEKRQLEHQWDGIKCKKCGTYHPYLTKCESCGKTLDAFQKEHKEYDARMRQMNMGIMLGGGPGGLLRCHNCGKIACSSCALVLPGHTEKTCPFCNEDYGYKDVIL